MNNPKETRTNEGNLARELVVSSFHGFINPVGCYRLFGDAVKNDSLDIRISFEFAGAFFDIVKYTIYGLALDGRLF